MRHVLAAFFVLILVSPNAYAQRGRGAGAAAAPSDGGPNGLGALHFRPLGPEGNRVPTVTGVPGDPMTFQTNFIGMLDHVGTHVDAFRHGSPNGATIDEMPLDLFMGEAVCFDLR